MCQIKSKYAEASTFTGYKVALKSKETGEYYSPFTGAVYREGRRMKPLKTARYVGEEPKNIREQPKIKFNSKMQGKTGVFVDKNSAQNLMTSFNYSAPQAYQIVLLEMTIKGGLYNAFMTWGFFFCGDTVIGSHIVAIKELA